MHSKNLSASPYPPGRFFYSWCCLGELVWEKLWHGVDEGCDMEKQGLRTQKEINRQAPAMTKI